jgi:hypothetical protein
MTTIASRTFRSSPVRSSADTWEAIIELLTHGEEGERRRDLKAVAGIASCLIAERAPAAAPIVVTCDGPRTRIYCVYDDDALDGEGNEDSLAFDPLQGDWSISLPCHQDDLSWVQAALNSRSTRISARDLSTGIASGEEKSASKGSLSLDIDEFLKS